MKQNSVAVLLRCLNRRRKTVDSKVEFVLAVGRFLDSAGDDEIDLIAKQARDDDVAAGFERLSSRLTWDGALGAQS